MPTSAVVAIVLVCAGLHLVRSDCLLPLNPPVVIKEGDRVCEPIRPWLNETDQDYGSRFLHCLNSRFIAYQCLNNMKFDINIIQCYEGPPKCFLQPQTSTIRPTLGTQPASATTATPVLQQSTQQVQPQPAPWTSTAQPTTTAQPTKPTTMWPTLNAPASTTRQPLTSTPQPPPTSTPQPPPTSTPQPLLPSVAQSQKQPISASSSTECNKQTCQLPNCFCFGATPDMEREKTPMMVMLSFDDAVTNAFNNDYYKKLLIDTTYNLSNPNSCPIKATFFLSTDYTDFGVVKQLYDKGNEFASHTMHHILADGGSFQTYEEEIVGVRNLLQQNSQVDPLKVVGFRAPYLKLSNLMFEVLNATKFKYDASVSNMENYKGRSHVWPYTYDFPIPPEKCPNGPCPTKSYKGFWGIPLNSWSDDKSYCSMIDACVIADPADDEPTVKEKYLKYFRKNFYNDFYPKKIPMEIFTHSALFLRNPGSFQALLQFIEELTKLKDVWFLTPSQVIDWMQGPVSQKDAIDGAILSWNCGTVKQ
ncbi:chitin deacetylase 8-like [Physella acuta]|uniref:chitin deacetylase 8-like n=1 Tax=Physella acuta TaxID=109671 RepID=UPI0027DAEFDF|nr:chitin deacetylase 8-like [Physella acuta]XP_059152268.1 chitin deacetylase 8-like [Physella acuta]